MTWGLRRRIAVTLGALFVYRVGLHIPLPGIDTRTLAEVFHGRSDLFRPASVLALGITPYITAGIFLQLAAIVSRRVRALAYGGEHGRQTLVRWTRYLTVVLAASQAWGVAQPLGGVRGLVANPGPLFIASAVITQTGGTLLLAWLADQITLRGLGNGIAILFLAGGALQLPQIGAYIWELAKQGLPTSQATSLALLTIAVTAFIVWIELARRELPVRFAGPLGDAIPKEGSAYLNLKFNPAGIAPVLVASWLFALLLAVGVAVGLAAGSYALRWLPAVATPFTWANLIVQAALIAVCAFVYTAFLLDPEAIAARLQKLGGEIDGVEPGEPTAAHLDNVISCTAIVGTAYLVLVSLLPYLLMKPLGVPFVLGGTALLIVVCTALDIVAQVRAELRLEQTAVSPL